MHKLYIKATRQMTNGTKMLNKELGLLEQSLDSYKKGDFERSLTSCVESMCSTPSRFESLLLNHKYLKSLIINDSLRVYINSFEFLDDSGSLVVSNSNHKKYNSFDNYHFISSSESESEFFSRALVFVLENRRDQVFLSTLDNYSICFFLLYNWVWNSKLVLLPSRENESSIEVPYWLECLNSKYEIIDKLRSCSDIDDLESYESLLDQFIGKVIQLLYSEFSSRYNNSSVTLLDYIKASTIDKSYLSKEQREVYSYIDKSNAFDAAWYRNKYSFLSNHILDPLSHYIAIGAAISLNPNENFSTEFYLNKYKSVKDKGVNPLFHYLKYGRGRDINAYTNLEYFNELENKGVDVFICCWLRNKESIHDGLIDFYNNLKSKGLRTKFITHSDAIYKKEGIDFINVSFSLLNTPVYKEEVEMPIPERVENDLLYVIKYRLISMSNETLAAKDSQLRKVIRQAYAYWKRVLNFNSPKFVFLWGSTCPMSRLLKFLCDELVIPYLVMERGHFPGTIGVNAAAQFYNSSSSLIPNNPQYDTDTYLKIKEWTEAHTEVPYAYKNKEISTEHKIFSDDRLKILFIGVNDVGSGIAYADKRVLEQHSTYYHSSYNALVDLHKAINIVCPEALLIIKPHPADKCNYEKIVSDNVILEQTTNINELIKVSDICVTLSTTSIAKCIVEEKPILLMSQCDISGQNIAYECVTPSDISVMLRSAINSENWSQKSANGKEFLCHLFAQNLFSFKESVSFMQPLKALAERVAYRVNRDIVKHDVFSNNTSLPVCTYRNFSSSTGFSCSNNYRKAVDIVIPVYADAEITRLAIDRALDTISEGPEGTRLIIINDASPDKEVQELFRHYEHLESENIIVLTNDINLGFSGTVNRAFKYSSERDFILLNSDAIVPKDFVSRLQNAAYAHYAISTVTPFSNNAGIYSIPLKTGKALEIRDAVSYVDKSDEVLRSNNEDAVVEMPVGHGFCMYVRRSAIDRIGYLDELTFGRGYSEEIDFCLRSRKAGLINVALPSMFVGHIGGVSFGDEATSMKIKNRKIIERRYKSYFPELKSFRRNDPLIKYRTL